MLRITPNNELSFRPGHRAFSAEMFKGFLLALAIHALLIVSLRLSLPPNLDAILPIAPIEVESDLGPPITAQAIALPIPYLPRQLPSLLSSHEYLLSLPCLNTFPIPPEQEPIVIMAYEPLECVIVEEWDD